MVIDTDFIKYNILTTGNDARESGLTGLEFLHLD